VLELVKHRDEFSGSIRVVFQPGEEGLAMAKELINAGALQNPPPDFVAALHCEPGLPVGTVGIRNGAMASSCLHFKVTFTGKGGHGSMPHRCCNPIPAAAAAVVALQNVANHRINAQAPSVISICNISGGSADNVIPAECCFSGTLRALDNETARELQNIIKEVCEAIALMHHVDCQVEAKGEYPATVNPVSGTEFARKSADAAGLRVVELSESAMRSEDFSYFLLNSPDGAFIRLGAGENQPPLHNCKFLPPDEIIPAGIKYMVRTALDFLKH
jgi:amidohydrolase